MANPKGIYNPNVWFSPKYPIYLLWQLREKFGDIVFIKNQYKKDFIILEIDTNDLDINLYKDVNLPNNGFYTINNIYHNKYIHKNELFYRRR